MVRTRTFSKDFDKPKDEKLTEKENLGSRFSKNHKNQPINTRFSNTH